jgi:hypothetical protein
MCTVSYLPLTKTEYILSSNRDETPLRSDTPFVEESVKMGRIYFPKDAKGGSWLFGSDFGWTICILNGAFIKHKHQPPYKLSRGLMGKAIFNYPSFTAFLAHFKFRGIEPFTCIMINDEKLLEFRWDGQEKFIRTLDRNEPHIWSSSTLYPHEMQLKRKGWFQEWLSNNPVFNVENIHSLHRTGGEGDIKNDYVMNRNNIVCTTSISHLVKHKKQTLMLHYNLQNEEKQENSFRNKVAELT